jgi:hypothetical protein
VSDVVYVLRNHGGSLDLLSVPVYPDPGAVRVLLTGLPSTAMGYSCTASADGAVSRIAAFDPFWRTRLGLFYGVVCCRNGRTDNHAQLTITTWY